MAIRKSLDLPFRIELCTLVFFHSEYVLFFREYSVSNISCKVLKGVLDHSRNVYVTLSELWLEARVQSDDVMEYQHLAVAKPPDPIPIVGTDTVSVMTLATSSVIISRTIPNAPAFSSDLASSTSLSLEAAFLP